MNRVKKPAARTHPTTPPQPCRTLRIIGGKWRGRKLHFPAQSGLRPTGDRIRETLFNWLTPHLTGANCLDLYAGSGALGFEAISRGASAATLVERSAAVYSVLQAHRELLAAHQQICLVNADALQWLQQPSTNRFDIVFLDPPFHGNYLPRTLQLLQASAIVGSGTLVYIEYAQDQQIILPGHWRALRSKCSGRVHYGLVEIGEISGT